MSVSGSGDIFDAFSASYSDPTPLVLVEGLRQRIVMPRRCQYLTQLPTTSNPTTFRAIVSGLLLDPSLPLGISVDALHVLLNLGSCLMEVNLHHSTLQSPQSFNAAFSPARSIYFHALKQSLVMRYGDTRALLSLNAADQDALWALVSGGGSGSAGGATAGFDSAPVGKKAAQLRSLLQRLNPPSEWGCLRLIKINPIREESDAPSSSEAPSSASSKAPTGGGSDGDSLQGGNSSRDAAAPFSASPRVDATGNRARSGSSSGGGGGVPAAHSRGASVDSDSNAAVTETVLRSLDTFVVVGDAPIAASIGESAAAAECGNWRWCQVHSSKHAFSKKNSSNDAMMQTTESLAASVSSALSATLGIGSLSLDLQGGNGTAAMPADNLDASVDSSNGSNSLAVPSSTHKLAASRITTTVTATATSDSLRATATADPLSTSRNSAASSVLGSSSLRDKSASLRRHSDDVVLLSLSEAIQECLKITTISADTPSTTVPGTRANEALPRTASATSNGTKASSSSVSEALSVEGEKAHSLSPSSEAAQHLQQTFGANNTCEEDIRIETSAAEDAQIATALVSVGGGFFLRYPTDTDKVDFQSLYSCLANPDGFLYLVYAPFASLSEDMVRKNLLASSLQQLPLGSISASQGTMEKKLSLHSVTSRGSFHAEVGLPVLAGSTSSHHRDKYKPST